jgi:hypothetical protein
MSYYSFPEEALELFGFLDVGDQKIYNQKTKVLSSSIQYAARLLNPRSKRDPELEARLPELASQLSDMIVGRYGDVENRIDEPVIVRSMSSFPMAYAEVREMFREKGLEYRDIRVVLVYDIQNPGVVGGYVPMSEAAVQQQLSIGQFPPPVIQLNVINRRLRNISDAVEVLVHEGSHYIDDIMVTEGLADKSRMFNPEPPRGGLDDMIRYLREYLSQSPTEFDAHAAMPFLHLKFVDAEILRDNRFMLKKRLLETLFLDAETEKIPLSGDVQAGAEILPVDLRATLDIMNEMVDVVDNDRNPERHYQTGESGYDTVQVTGVADDQSGVTIQPPLSSSYYMADGAAISFPAAQSTEVRGESELLYSRIIDHAFELALQRSLPEGNRE